MLNLIKDKNYHHSFKINFTNQNFIYQTIETIQKLRQSSLTEKEKLKQATLPALNNKNVSLECRSVTQSQNRQQVAIKSTAVKVQYPIDITNDGSPKFLCH